MTTRDSIRVRLDLAHRQQELVQDHLAGASGELLLARAQFAGNLAWTSHGGRFALPRVEQVLREDRSLSTGCADVAASQVAGRTLHILTEAYATGGHTRLARRWIELMEDEPSAVLLVRQQGPMDPAWVAPAGRGIPVVDLEAESVTAPLEKVDAVRRYIEAARRVVFHIHPDDACSVAAGHLSGRRDLRILDHADHVAWLGAGLPAVLLGGRSGGSDLAVRRRGIDRSQCDYVPIPLSPPPRTDRAAARRDLGFSSGDVVLLTIATGYKFLPIDGRSLLEPLAAAMKTPGLRIVAIGPDHGHPVFGTLADLYPGRVQALGPIPDPWAFRAAADIYLDSFPFCSTTSLLESAMLGTPVVAYQPDPSGLGIFYSDWPTLPSAWFAAGTPEALLQRLRSLVASTALRGEEGDRLRAATRVHLPGLWQEAMLAHQRREFLPGAWSGEAIRGTEPMDLVLQGLGRDPRKYPRLAKWPLPLMGKLRMVIDRLTA